MATSRGATPADPVLAATTDDNSRGGLFARSNTGNPVSGLNVISTDPNNSLVTLNFQYADSTSQQATFRLNQADDYEMTLTIPGTTSSGGGGDTRDDAIVGVTFSNDQLVFERVDGTNPPENTINLSSLDNSAEITTMIAAVRRDLVTTFAGLTDGPGDLGTAGEYLTRGTGATANQLIWTSLPGTNLTTDEIESADNTIVDATGTQTGRVDLSARPAWTGNNGMGNNVNATTTVNATRVVLAENTGLVLTRNASTGVVTIQAANRVSNDPVPEEPTPSSALDAPTQAQRTIEYTPAPGSGDRITDITITEVTGPNGMITIPPANIDTTDPNRGTVEIPSSDIEDRGNYRVQATVETTSPDGETRDTDEDNTIMRILPYFQSRSDIVTASDLDSLTPSTAELVASTGIARTIAGASPLYVAAPASVLPNNILFVTPTGGLGIQITRERGFPVTLADGITTVNYNVFSIPTAGEIGLTNFRSSFF